MTSLPRYVSHVYMHAEVVYNVELHNTAAIIGTGYISPLLEKFTYSRLPLGLSLFMFHVVNFVNYKALQSCK